MPSQLYRAHELNFRIQYAELKERTLAFGQQLPGTPGSLVLREGSGYRHWYRVSYPVPGRVQEDWVCKDGDNAALDAMRERMAHHEWATHQVSLLRKLGFQVADKAMARILVELHNRQAFEAGLVLVGTPAYMAWLNELGGATASGLAQDVDPTRRQPLKLGASLQFQATTQAAGLPFSSVPGMAPAIPSASAELPSGQGLRIDVLAYGKASGASAEAPEIDWRAQIVPFYDYLLLDAEPGAMLAGGHCVPVRLPQAGRFVWHKLYASTQRRDFPGKAAKDRQQALVLAALLADSGSHWLTDTFYAAPAAMKSAILPIVDKLIEDAAAHAGLVDALQSCRGQAV
jgi:hypothetical protein